MSRFLNRRSGAALAVIALIAAGGAYAYWTQGGSGDGTATTGTSTALVVNQTSSVTDLYPGGPPQDLEGNFTNPNDGTIRINTTLAVTATVDDPTGACSSADYVIDGDSVVTQADLLTGATGGAWSGLTIAMNNTASNQDACKNAVITISYTAV